MNFDQAMGGGVNKTQRGAGELARDGELDV